LKKEKKSVVLSVVLYGNETWSLKFREERRLRVVRTGFRGECLGLKGLELQEDGENCIMRSSIIYTLL
jgi:hypothetical protein